MVYSSYVKPFNSHPHKEDDYINWEWQQLTSLSTHILTRRMTVNENRSAFKLALSTHILTRRMTAIDSPGSSTPVLSTHILTRRMTNRWKKS